MGVFALFLICDVSHIAGRVATAIAHWERRGNEIEGRKPVGGNEDLAAFGHRDPALAETRDAKIERPENGGARLEANAVGGDRHKRVLPRGASGRCIGPIADISASPMRRLGSESDLVLALRSRLYLSPAQKRWMRAQASVSASVDVA